MTVTVRVSGVLFGDLNGNGKQEEGERGVGGVRVEILEAASARVAAGNLVQRVATSDGSGRFHFDGVPVGEYAFHLTPPAGMTLLSPAVIPLVVGSHEGEMPLLLLAVAVEPAPVLLPLVGN